MNEKSVAQKAIEVVLALGLDPKEIMLVEPRMVPEIERGYISRMLILGQTYKVTVDLKRGEL